MTKHRSALLLLTALLVTAELAFSVDNDVILRKVLDASDVRPLETKPFESTPKYVLGQALFFDPILSGQKDISCATCHIFALGSSDNIPLSIGPGGSGLGRKRKTERNDVAHPRNALDLWNRDNATVTSLFWDGRIEQHEPNSGRFITPMWGSLPAGLENLLAVQALFPLVAPDEMLGGGDNEGRPTIQNELVANTLQMHGPERFLTIYDLIMDRLVGDESSSKSEGQSAYLRLFRAAYPNERQPFNIVHVANAIAHFEEFAFSTRSAAWDAYVRGDLDAISESAKEGALVFFGRGRCAVCHSGPLFSDFQFHSIGVPRSELLADLGKDDFGRFSVTGLEEDMFKFRTPPLRNVSLTAPYFHNGISQTLDDAIHQHLDPYRYGGSYLPSGDYAMGHTQFAAISVELPAKASLNDTDIRNLIAFLLTLEDRVDSYESKIVIQAVPSNLPVQ